MYLPLASLCVSSENRYLVKESGLTVPDSKPPAIFISDLRPSRVATIDATVSELQPAREIVTRGGRKTRDAGSWKWGRA